MYIFLNFVYLTNYVSDTDIVSLVISGAYIVVSKDRIVVVCYVAFQIYLCFQKYSCYNLYSSCECFILIGITLLTVSMLLSYE